MHLHDHDRGDRGEQRPEDGEQPGLFLVAGLDGEG